MGCVFEEFPLKRNNKNFKWPLAPFYVTKIELINLHTFSIEWLLVQWHLIVFISCVFILRTFILSERNFSISCFRLTDSGPLVYFPFTSCCSIKKVTWEIHGYFMGCVRVHTLGLYMGWKGKSHMPHSFPWHSISKSLHYLKKKGGGYLIIKLLFGLSANSSDLMW